MKNVVIEKPQDADGDQGDMFKRSVPEKLTEYNQFPQTVTDNCVTLVHLYYK